ncbi:PSD1 and planctomycete cytochrome C domain-containing protein [Akkermansiaceae bacterium]|nr:PSD1 and planctomycete cytochrome C domain-containing protein [bacterium]MDA7907848.1 PSD1 and planctomycete cytochrome C domain-containing protein [Akkermansiaceae bacterium]MDB4572734.1 PSD1 and planctomycete cytochrome C domain-containing protein [Akkermansiaceae bacterium]
MRKRYLLPLFLSSQLPAAEKVDFSREVRPILNTNCLPCHGGVKKSGDVSFLYREEALATGKSGKPTVVPGDPGSSEMLIRILSDDPDEVMPQPKHGAPLKPHEADLIRRWIKEGAEWNNHWSFEKPTRHKASATSDPNWHKTAIDPFVLAKLGAKNLTPSPPASGGRLLRRLSLDLVGTPPSLALLDRFENAYADNPDQAVAEVVDKLLADEGFGEKWASQWLDVARYADSEGLGADRRWNAWPYRDWVIRALNQDMPYDQFLIKQLAGDLLPNPTLDDLIATTFHRLTQQNAEGGTDNEEFRVMAVMDRVNTTWKGLQGITFGCVQCHEHPYEPIRHHEYYEFMALFNNSRDLDLNTHHPTLKVPEKTEDYASAAKLRSEYRNLQTKLQNQARQLIANAGWTKVSRMTINSEKVGSKSRQLDGYQEFLTEGTIPNNIVFKLEIPKPDSLQELTAFRIHTLPLDVEKAIHSPELGAVLSRIILKTSLPDQESLIEIPLAHVLGDDDFPMWNPNDSLKKGGSGWGAYTHQNHARSCVVILKEALKLPDGSKLQLELHHNAAAPTGPMATKRGRLDLSSDPAFQNWLTSPATIEALDNQDRALADYNKLGTTSLAIMERLQPGLQRDTRTFKRGNWLEKDEQSLTPGIPESLGALNYEKDALPTRLHLAKWMTGRSNPFTSRVMVARVWGQIFGRSLVETLEDFGSTGIAPSHPDLLDDLAVRFETEMNHSLKTLIREILLSATYRQSSKKSSISKEKDPLNIYLSRGPRNRLSAEQVRDHHLAASGLLTKKPFGPPVRPPIPAGVWKPFSDGPWNAAKVGDPDRYRRSIYTYWKRSIPFPAFGAFDAPTRENCSSRRLVSNTPLAALATLNDEAFSEMAQGLARRMKYETEGDLETKIATGFRIATSLKPGERQMKILMKLFSETAADYEANSEPYSGLAGTADGAAFTIVANTLLNMDDALTK